MLQINTIIDFRNDHYSYKCIFIADCPCLRIKCIYFYVLAHILLLLDIVGVSWNNLTHCRKKHLLKTFYRCHKQGDKFLESKYSVTGLKRNRIFFFFNSFILWFRFISSLLLRCNNGYKSWTNTWKNNNNRNYNKKNRNFDSNKNKVVV